MILRGYRCKWALILHRPKYKYGISIYFNTFIVMVISLLFWFRNNIILWSRSRLVSGGNYFPNANVFIRKASLDNSFTHCEVIGDNCCVAVWITVATNSTEDVYVVVVHTYISVTLAVIYCWTLGSWVRIQLGAWMYVCRSSLFFVILYR
jgi:uncharacterized membrane protein YagU involved in acid resistance